MVNIQNKKKDTKTRILYLFGVILLLTSIILGYYKCPFDYLFGVPCPLCGMSRALLSVFRLNFEKAFYYHAFWPLIPILLPINYIIKKEDIRINKKLVNSIYIYIGILLIVYYILRHYYSSPVVEIHYEDSLISNIINFFR